jgi:hypothetical protein
VDDRGYGAYPARRPVYPGQRRVIEEEEVGGPPGY